MNRIMLPNVVYRELTHSEPPQSPVACFYRRNETAPAALAFIQAMKRHRLRA